MGKIELTHQLIPSNNVDEHLNKNKKKKHFKFYTTIDDNTQYDLINVPEIKEHRLSVYSKFEIICNDKIYQANSQRDYTVTTKNDSLEIPENPLLQTIDNGIAVTVSFLSEFYRNNQNICPSEISDFLESLKNKEELLKNAQVERDNLNILPEIYQITEQNKERIFGGDVYSVEW